MMRERGHRFQQRSHGSQPRYREKAYRTGGGFGREVIAASDVKPGSGDLVSMGRAHVEGNGQFRKRTSSLKVASDSTSGSDSSIDENSFALDSRRSSSKKASGAPIKTLIDEEMSRGMEITRPSPSVIGKLMGLDALPPPPVVYKQHKEMGSLKKTSLGFQKYISDVDHSLRTSTCEHQEFKDVFEVIDSLKGAKHKNQPVHKGMPCLKRDETNMDFIRQKFIEAKRLSTDETLQNSKEFNDTLEVLDSNKDLFLKCLQEPNSLFTKHLSDLKCFSPSPHASHITILKSTKVKKYESNEECRISEGKAERCTHIQKDAISSLRKPTSSLVSRSLKEHTDSLSHKLLKSRYAGKCETSFHPTRIVVLKPSLGKAQNTARTVSLPRSHEDDQFGYRRNRELWQSGIQELHAEGKEQQKLFNNVEIMGHKIKGSREIAREITKQMKHSVGSSSEKVSISGFNRYIKDERSYVLSGMSNWNSPDAYQRTPDNFDVWNSSHSPSSSDSTELSVSREARKRLSERWRMTHRFQEGRLLGRGSSTLGEMLALSDRETPKETLDAFIIEKASDERSTRDEELGTRLPSGISSRDGWKDGCSINLPRSMSLPSSSTVYRTPKPSSRQRVGGSNNCNMLKDVLNLGSDDSFHRDFNQRGSSSRRNFKFRSYKRHSVSSCVVENKLPVREIHINPEELTNGIHVTDLAEVNPMLSKLSDSTIANSSHLVENSSLPECMDGEVPFMMNEEQVPQPVKDGEFSGNDHNDKIIEQTSPDHPEVESLPSQCDRTESESLASAKEAEQPSPVSVLDPPSEDDKPSPGCFERVSADLQELRMQLQLLKLESSDTYPEESEALILSEEDAGDCSSPSQKGEILLQAFRNEEDRDFSYLLDILINSGVHGANQDRNFDACYSPEHPVDPSVFEKLEKKYGVLVEWSISERRLLFNLINSILAEIFTQSMDLHPLVEPKRKVRPILGRERFVEEVWQMVVRQRKELSGGNLEEKILDPRWLDLGDYVDMMGRMIEKMLNEDLFEELISEFISGESWNC